mgnify:CR=1 FL=1
MNFIDKLKNRRVLIIGDVMIDRYVFGNVTRISPEAPVPVVNFVRQEDRLGGAGNVALNVQALGSEAIVFSVIGTGEMAENWHRLFQKNNLSEAGLVLSNFRRSTIKTRIIGNGQQILRLDSEDTNDILEMEEVLLLEKVSVFFEKSKPDVVILQDYNKGVLTEMVIKTIVELANSHGVPTAVDPKKDRFFDFKNVTLFKPNLKEIRDATGLTVEPNLAGLAGAAGILRSKLGHAETMITLSEHGIYTEKSGIGTIWPTKSRQVADVSGAGDTVIAVAALGLAAGLSMPEIARICNVAGGQVCEVLGVVAVDPDKLEHELLME